MPPRVHLVNPSHVAFGVAVITPRWVYVLAAAAGTEWGDPVIVDETLEQIDQVLTKGQRFGSEPQRIARQALVRDLVARAEATLLPAHAEAALDAAEALVADDPASAAGWELVAAAATTTGDADRVAVALVRVEALARRDPG